MGPPLSPWRYSSIVLEKENPKPVAIPKVCPWPSNMPFHFERVAGDVTSDDPARREKVKPRIQACVAQRLAGGGRQTCADRLSYRVS